MYPAGGGAENLRVSLGYRHVLWTSQIQKVWLVIQLIRCLTLPFKDTRQNMPNFRPKSSSATCGELAGARGAKFRPALITTAPGYPKMDQKGQNQIGFSSATILV